MITSISHIYHRVRDLDEAIEFFTQKLGFTLLRKYVQQGRPQAYVELGNVLLQLSAVRDPADLPAGEPADRHFGLNVTDIDAVFADFKRKGVDVVADPHPTYSFWGRQGAIRDPSGHVIPVREWEAPDSPRYPDWQPRDEGVTRLA